jgi:hypothetical protein
VRLTRGGRGVAALPLAVFVLVLAGIAGCSQGARTETPSEPGERISIAEVVAAAPTKTVIPSDAMRTVTPAATPAPAVAIPSGWQPFHRAGDGFSIAIPPTWTGLDLDPQTANSVLRSMTAQNPQFSSILNEQARTLLTAGGLYIAFDASPAASASGFATNVNVLKEDLPLDMSLALYTQVTVGNLEKVSGISKPIQKRTVTLPGGEATELTYSAQLRSTEGRPTDLSYTQYLLVSKRRAFVVTFTARKDQAANFNPVFEQIAQTIQITSGASQ